MKKLFNGIGIFIALFSILFFFYLADKKEMIMQTDPEYDFILSDYISGEKLEKIAIDSNVTIEIKDYKNISFGHDDITVTFIHADNNLKEGVQRSIFPQKKIVYKKMENGKERNIQFFSVKNGDRNKIQKLQKLIEKENMNVDIEKEEAMPFSATMVFNSLQLQFFVLVFLLAVFCIASYYVKRSKEIGILKLNGWNTIRISAKLMKTMLFHTVNAAMIFALPFTFYILKMDSSMLTVYIRLWMYLLLFLLGSYTLAVSVGLIFVSRINVVNAIKNKTNNRLNFYLLLLVKIVIVLCTMMNMSSLIEQIDYARNVVHDIKELEELNLSMVNTSVVPSREMQKRLNRIIGNLSDQDVYNYGSSETLYHLSEIEKNQADRTNNYIEISDNLLPELKVLNCDGKAIKKIESPHENMLLIPQQYRKDEKKILEDFGSEDVEVYYIKDHQIYKDILEPGLYAVNPMIWVHKVRKTLWINSGEVLYSKSGAATIKKALDEMQIDKGSLYLRTMKSDYDILKYNAQTDVVENGLFVLMNLCSYILCVFAIVVVYLEFRKKELGVYILYDQMPYNTILRFLSLNEAITIIEALVIRKTFVLLAFVEVVYFGFAFWKYMNKKAILAIKGE